MSLFLSQIRDFVKQLKLLKGMQAGMQLELYYEWLGQARHQMWLGFATFARTM